MSTKYNRKNLSDALAQLGAELGRAPKPEDLRKGMALYRTYLKYFDNDWGLALEYAGYPREAPVQPAEEESPWAPHNVKLINLMGKDVDIVGPNGLITLVRGDFHARVTLAPPTKARAGHFLREIIGGADVNVGNDPLGISIFDRAGVAHAFPAPQPGVYLLVNRLTAHSARTLGRATYDLIYPGTIRNAGSRVTIYALEMVASRDLWRL